MAKKATTSCCFEKSTAQSMAKVEEAEFAKKLTRKFDAPEASYNFEHRQKS